MKGTTASGNKLSLRTPGMVQVESVPSAKDINGMTHNGFKNSVKSSQTAGFAASRKAGSIKGETC